MFRIIRQCIVLSVLGLGSWVGAAAAVAGPPEPSTSKLAVPAGPTNRLSFAAFFGGATRGKATKVDPQKKSIACAWTLTRDNMLLMWLPGGILFRVEPRSIDRSSHTLITQVIVVDTLGLVDDPRSWAVVGGGQMDFSITPDGAIEAVSQMSWGMVKQSVVKSKGPAIRRNIIPD
jgi:hypothetical protein